MNEFQEIIFSCSVAVFAIALIFFSGGEDDDDQGGGMMQPVYQGINS